MKLNKAEEILKDIFMKLLLFLFIRNDMYLNFSTIKILHDPNDFKMEKILLSLNN